LLLTIYLPVYVPCSSLLSHGLGLAGRVEIGPERYQGDSYASPQITDLSQITRQQYNPGSAQGKTAHRFQY
jgi:hypothetical protein